MEYYPEHSGRDSVDLAGKGYLPQYGNSGLHLLDELVVIRPVHSDLILFLVIILGTEKSIDYRAVVGEKYKSRRILIKSPDGEYPVRIANVIDYVGRISAVCSARLFKILFLKHFYLVSFGFAGQSLWREGFL